MEMSRKTTFPALILPGSAQSVDSSPSTVLHITKKERSQAWAKARLIECLLCSVDEGDIHLFRVHFDQPEPTEEDRTSPVEFQGTTGNIFGVCVTVVDEVRCTDHEVIHLASIQLIDEML